MIRKKNFLAVALMLATVAVASVGVACKEEKACTHDYGTKAVSITKEATCEGKGESLWKCKHCGEEKK